MHPRFVAFMVAVMVCSVGLTLRPVDGQGCTTTRLPTPVSSSPWDKMLLSPKTPFIDADASNVGFATLFFRLYDTSGNFVKMVRLLNGGTQGAYAYTAEDMSDSPADLKAAKLRFITNDTHQEDVVGPLKDLILQEGDFQLSFVPNYGTFVESGSYSGWYTYLSATYEFYWTLDSSPVKMTDWELADVTLDGMGDVIILTNTALNIYQPNLALYVMSAGLDSSSYAQAFDDPFLIHDQAALVDDDPYGAFLAVLDFDVDGLDDVLFSSSAYHLSWMRNTATGSQPISFAAPEVFYTVPSGTSTLLIFGEKLDVNLDGFDDLVFALNVLNTAGGGTRLIVLAHSGTSAGFLEPIQIGRTFGQLEKGTLSFGDINNDGFVDLAYFEQDVRKSLFIRYGGEARPSYFGPEIMLWFSAETQEALVAITPVTGTPDRPDIVVVETQSAHTNDFLHVFKSESVLAFDTAKVSLLADADYATSSSMLAWAATFVDWTGDGYVDMFVPMPTQDSVRMFAQVSSGGVLGLSTSPDTYSGLPNANLLFPINLDGDYRPDILALGQDGSTYQITLSILGMGDTTGSVLWSEFDAGAVAVQGWVVDWDRNGAPDFLFSTRAGEADLFVSLHNGTSLAAPVSVLGSLTPKMVELGDVNGDNAADVVTVHASSNTLRVSLNDGAGALLPATVVTVDGSLDANIFVLTLVDVDEDLVLDLVVGMYAATGKLVIAYNDGAGVFDGGATVDAHLLQTLGGSLSGLRSLVAADLDGDGTFSDIMFGNGECCAGVMIHSRGSVPPTWSDINDVLYTEIVIEDTGDKAEYFAAAPVVDGDAAAEFFVGSGSTGKMFGFNNLGESPFRSLSSPANIAAGVAGGAALLVPSKAPAAAYPLCASKSMACIAELLSRVSSCAPTLLFLESGTYTGCPISSRIAIRGDVTIRPVDRSAGPLIFDCKSAAPGTGALFDVVGGASLTLEDVAIIGATGLVRTTENVRGTTPVIVSGSGSSLVLTRVNVTGCSSHPDADMVFPQILGGYGGFASVDGGGSVIATDCMFVSNTAGQLGGVFAITGTESSLVLTSSVLSDNVALTGDGLGGALAVGPGQAAVVMDNVVMKGNTARLAGGAVAVLDSSARLGIVSAGSRFVGNSAVHGGAFAVLPSRNTALATPFSSGAVAVASMATNAAMAVPAGANLASALTADGRIGQLQAGAVTMVVSGSSPLTVAGNTASAGGVLFVCDAYVRVDSPIAVEANPNTASVAGGFVFSCLTSDAAASAVSNATTIPFVAVASGAADAAVSGAAQPKWGSTSATPGSKVAFVDGSEVPSSLMSGLGISSGLAGMFDMYGTAVVDATVILKLELDQASVDAGLEFSSLELRVLSKSPVSFTGLAIAAAPSLVASLPVSVQLTLTVSDTSGAVVPTATTTTTVGLCDVGYGRVSGQDEVLVCAACVGDQFSVQVSDAPCNVTQECPLDVERIDGVCVPCPEFTARQAIFVNQTAALDGTLYTPCSCLVGYFSPSGAADVACLACPEGGECVGGLNRPRSLPGFFDTSGDGTSFTACLRQSACVGAAYGDCAVGSTGYMCNTCVDGYYSGQDKECHKCPDESEGIIVTFALIVVVGGLVVAVVAACVLKRHQRKRNARTGKGSSDSSADVEGGHAAVLAKRSRSTMPRSLALGLTLAQVLGLLGSSSEIGWPSSTKNALNVFEIANLDVHFATECSFGSFSTKYIVSLVYPLVFVAMAMVSCVLLKVFAPRLATKVSLRSVLEKIVFVGGPLLYIPLARSALILFDCTKLPNGKWALDSDLSLECFDSAWWSLVPFGIAGLALYVVLVPAVIGLILWYNRKRLLDPAVLSRYGSIYKLFRVKWAPFELLVLFKKLVIIGATLFFSSYPLWMIFIVAGVFSVFALIHAHFDIYLAPTYNTLEIRLNVAATLILVFAFAFYADRFPSSEARNVFAYTAIGIVIIAFLLLIHAFIKELNGLRRSSLVDVRESVFWTRFANDAANFTDPAFVEALDEIRAHRPRGLLMSSSPSKVHPFSHAHAHAHAHPQSNGIIELSSVVSSSTSSPAPSSSSTVSTGSDVSML